MDEIGNDLAQVRVGNANRCCNYGRRLGLLSGAESEALFFINGNLRRSV